MIHPTAIVHPHAQLDSSVEVGPYSIIDAHVTVGAGCRIGPHVHLTGHTTIGEGNVFHTGCVIGDAPQDLKYKGEPTGVRIGDRNVFREHATVHRSAKLEELTLIGSDNFLMASCHVGHNVTVGNHVILANGVLLAGHAQIDDRAFLSGNALVHQFARVGTLAIMQGGSAISKDLPPFTVARGQNGICGLNIVGLRRAGFTPPQRLELKRLYAHLFRHGGRFQEKLRTAKAEFTGSAALTLLGFVESTRRGLCADTGKRPMDSDDAE